MLCALLRVASVRSWPLARWTGACRPWVGSNAISIFQVSDRWNAVCVTVESMTATATSRFARCRAVENIEQGGVSSAAGKGACSMKLLTVFWPTMALCAMTAEEPPTLTAARSVLDRALANDKVTIVRVQ